MSAAYTLYKLLPPPARSLAASLRGHYLNRWRYGNETDSLVNAALKRELWSERDWDEWRSERLKFVLHRAATQVPFYRRQWAKRRERGDRSSWDVLENWDVLEKEVIRVDPLAFVADDCNPSRMFHDHTSGTTGTSLSLYIKKETVREWYSLFEARSREWYGVSRHDRWAIFGGQLVAPVHQTKPPFWVWNSGLNQLYMSSYHLTARNTPAYIDAIEKHGIRYLLGYPSSIYALASDAIRLGKRISGLVVVILNAEPVYKFQRDVIETAFGCPVRETYGMAEVVAAAGECEFGRLHQWPEVGIIEATGDDETSDFICTGLLNADMPLVRYRVGDSGRLSSIKCECGRTLPVIDNISGRTDDTLFTKDGRRVGRMDPVFKGDLPIKEAQIVQESLSRITVNYVPAAEFEDSALGDLRGRILERLGDIDIDFTRMSMIPRTSRGKFRAVISKLDLRSEDAEAIGERQ